VTTARRVPIDGPVVAEWTRLPGAKDKNQRDRALAATAHAHGFVLVTRNIDDIRGCNETVFSMVTVLLVVLITMPATLRPRDGLPHGFRGKDGAGITNIDSAHIVEVETVIARTDRAGIDDTAVAVSHQNTGQRGLQHACTGV